MFNFGHMFGKGTLYIIRDVAIATSITYSEGGGGILSLIASYSEGQVRCHTLIIDNIVRIEALQCQYCLAAAKEDIY